MNSWTQLTPLIRPNQSHANMNKVDRILASEPIECLELLVRGNNALRRNGIGTVGELYDVILNDDLSSIRGLGLLLCQNILDRFASVEVVDIWGEPYSTDKHATEDVNTRIHQLQERIDALANTVNEIILWQKNTIHRQIASMLLHDNVISEGKSVGHWIKDEEPNPHYAGHLPRVLARILWTTCITEELAYLVRTVSLRDIGILIQRYGFTPKTYEQIGSEYELTRERIRQILGKGVERIANRARLSLQSDAGYESPPPLARSQTALCIARQLELDVTFSAWAGSLTNTGLLGAWRIKNDFADDPIELFVAVCNILAEEGFQEFSLPENLECAIQLASDKYPDVPARNLQIIKSLPKEIQREIRRHTDFSGGVQARWLSQEIEYDLEQVNRVLLALGYKSVERDWYIPIRIDGQDRLTRNDVFEHCLRKMTQYCGPLRVEDVCAGLGHTLYRTRYPVPPPDVMKKVLESRGYSMKDNRYYWDGPIEEGLSRGEEIILGCLRSLGSVVHHAEMAQTFIDSELSFASLHGTLSRTPIVEKVDSALYKLRGANTTHQDVERASKAGERIPVDLLVNYDRTGKIKLEATLGTLAIGTGVILSENLPNLTGDWQCIIDGQSFDHVTITENEIRKLLRPLEYLQCETADRIRLSFDTWTRTVSLEKVQSGEN